MSSLVHALVHHYDELVDYVRRAVGAHAQARHVARDSAREAVHDVCLQLLSDDTGSTAEVKVPLAFLRTLSKRRAIDRARRETTWQGMVGSIEDHPEALSRAAADADQPERRESARQQLALMVQAIEALPPRCREVFVLHKIHEWPQGDVAAHLGISIKTVEKHLRVGLACCRFALGMSTAEAVA